MHKLVVLNVPKVKAIIVEKGLTQTRFCHEVDIAPASLTRSIQGKEMLSLNSIIKIADYAGIKDVRELLLYK
jgi:predicted transcriptional regulator